MNAQYLSQLDFDALRPHLEPFLAAAGLEGADPARLAAAVNLHRTRARTLKDIAELIVPYFSDGIAYDPEANAKFLKDPDLPGHLDALRDRYAGLPTSPRRPPTLPCAPWPRRGGSRRES